MAAPRQYKSIELVGTEWEDFVDLTGRLSASWVAIIDYEISEAIEITCEQVSGLESKIDFENSEKSGIRPIFTISRNLLNDFVSDMKHKVAMEALIQAFLEPQGRFSGDADNVNLDEIDETLLHAAFEKHVLFWHAKLR